MEALSDESSFSRHSREQDEGRYASGNLVLWIAAIAILIGLNFASWSFCMWVFGQPEHPMNYRLLTRLDKLEPIVGFTPVSAPRGKFHSAKDLYSKVYSFNETELRAYNGILKRHYLRNFAERDDATYLAGEFTVLSVQRMGEGDVFSGGIVVRGRSTIFPDAVLDLALPAEDVPEGALPKPGRTIKVEESSTCAAVLHIERLEDSTMIFTAVPLVERQYEFGDGPGIPLKPQERIRIEPDRWPISEDIEAIEAKPVKLSDEPEEEPEADSDPE
ncbi:MAG: hypothetical protein WD342_18010 [Verrucomicrobiales bacterium]